MAAAEATGGMTLDEVRRVGEAFLCHTNEDLCELFDAIEGICYHVATWDVADARITKMIQTQERWLWARLSIKDILATSRIYFTCAGTETV